MSVSTDRLFQLNELTHELSNTVGMTVNYLLLASIGPSDAAFDDVMTAMELATKATSTLRMLMWQLGEIQRLAGLSDSLVGGNDYQ